MVQITVAAASLNQIPLDWNGNKARIIQTIEEARAREVQLLCLPELALTGYGCEDMFLSPAVHARALSTLQSLLEHTKGIVVNVGMPVAFEDRVYNCAAVIGDEKLLGFIAKKHLCGDGVHYEPRWFAAWPVGKESKVGVGRGMVPFGDAIFALNGIRIGYEICEDSWVNDRHGVDLAARGVQLIANPSASHFAFHKRAIVDRIVTEGSTLCGGGYIFANLLGCEAGRTIYGGDRLIAIAGKVIASGERLTFRDVELTTATLDIAPSYKPSPVSVISIKLPAPSTPHPVTPLLGGEPIHTPWEKNEKLTLLGKEANSLKFEEFSRAVALGLFDYMRKSRSKGFVVSLSGGADSSATACLVYLMRCFALRDLGAAGLSKKLSFWQSIPEALTGSSEMKSLLCLAYQATSSSSTTTHDAAAELAKALGATFYNLELEPLVDGYKKIVSAVTGHEFTWEHDDLALQNIQARVRSPSIWMLANYIGALLLTTSNRSEAAVGYATMDGDTSGGLSPLGGIDKAFLRRWLVWLETIGPVESGPIAALKAVNALAPTAELRPSTANQTDEADLMPYDVLDVIERLAVRDKISPIATWEAITSRMPQYSKLELGSWVEKFFRLWAASQWKRERYAPSFHLDDESLDPKTWCRFPILSGGFEAELAELRIRLR